jgi:hypothetical protein
MQDFRSYNYTLTPAQLLALAESAPDKITVIINGEYYDIKPEAGTAESPRKFGNHAQ